MTDTGLTSDAPQGSGTVDFGASVITLGCHVGEANAATAMFNCPVRQDNMFREPDDPSHD